ncbi:MAG TPA: methionyl-tRNA formyltransferase [Thermoanaerobaculia bacterium]|nr:methionyl-tRNA formyltransferase [Thermoanaerobaculia bacterium]
MRIVFFGTPSFAVPTLEALVAKHDVVMAVAQPDRPAGRGMKLHKPPVAERAAQLGIEVIQPRKIRDEAFLTRMAATNADLAVVVAYGRILPARLLAIPRQGFVNVHASILPKYRGAAPIQRAIAAGDTKTGVTIMRVDEELDHGPMLLIEALEIGPHERMPSVSQRLATLGAAALVRALDDLGPGTPQDHSRATYAPKIEKSEGHITFAESSSEIYNRFRAFDPWPGLFFGEVKVPELARAEGGGEAGRILSIDRNGVTVAAGEGAIRLIELQRAGKNRAPATDVARVLGWQAGDRIS